MTMVKTVARRLGRECRDMADVDEADGRGGGRHRHRGHKHLFAFDDTALAGEDVRRGAADPMAAVELAKRLLVTSNVQDEPPVDEGIGLCDIAKVRSRQSSLPLAVSFPPDAGNRAHVNASLNAKLANHALARAPNSG